MPVGRVVDLHVRYETTAAHQSLVSALCEFDRNIIRTDKGEEVDVTQRAAVQSLIDHGLSAQLGVSGFATGTLYVDLEFLDPSRPRRRCARRHPVPGRAVAALADLGGRRPARSRFVTKINQIDFKGIAAELQGLLADARRQVDSLDLKGLGDQWKQTGAAAEALVNSPEIKQTFLTLDATLGDVRGVVGRLDHQIDANGKDLSGTLQRGAGHAAAVRRCRASPCAASSPPSRISATTRNQTLAQLADAADAVERLADFLERNPNALISGKQAAAMIATRPIRTLPAVAWPPARLRGRLPDRRLQRAAPVAAADPTRYYVLTGPGWRPALRPGDGSLRIGPEVGRMAAYLKSRTWWCGTARTNSSSQDYARWARAARAGHRADAAGAAARPTRGRARLPAALSLRRRT